MLKGQFEVVMNKARSDRAKRNRVAALRARIEQTEFYVSNMRDQLHKDRLALALEMNPELSSDNELCGAIGEEA
tara:strand:- start:39 stop:260 length:222 start_codon:yes stop_codon:yes gene_type:complete